MSRAFRHCSYSYWYSLGQTKHFEIDIVYSLQPKTSCQSLTKGLLKQHFEFLSCVCVLTTNKKNHPWNGTRLLGERPNFDFNYHNILCGLQHKQLAVMPSISSWIFLQNLLFWGIFTWSRNLQTQSLWWFWWRRRPVFS